MHLEEVEAVVGGMGVFGSLEVGRTVVVILDMEGIAGSIAQVA